MDLDQTCKYLGADSIQHLTIEKMLDVFGEQRGDFCTACFDGCYPIDVKGLDEDAKQLGLFS